MRPTAAPAAARAPTWGRTYAAGYRRTSVQARHDLDYSRTGRQDMGDKTGSSAMHEIATGEVRWTDGNSESWWWVQAPCRRPRRLTPWAKRKGSPEPCNE